MLRVHSIESRANVGAGVRSGFANSSKHIVSLADRRIKFAARELTQGGAPSDSAKAPCGGAGPESSGGRAGQTSCTPRAAVTAIAHNNLIHPIGERYSIPNADLVRSAPERMDLIYSTKWSALDPEQIKFPREVYWPKHRKHIAWPRSQMFHGTKLARVASTLQIRYTSAEPSPAGQFLRLGDEVFARKPKTRRRAMCKLSHVHEQNSPSHTAATGQQSCPPPSALRPPLRTAKFNLHWPLAHTNSGVVLR